MVMVAYGYGRIWLWSHMVMVMVMIDIFADKCYILISSTTKEYVMVVLEQIKNDINELTAEEHRDLIVWVRDTLTLKIKQDLNIGGAVQFEHNGQLVKGNILKKNPSRAKVKTEIGTWNVPYQLLDRVL